jgi:hypothetical protein
MGPARGAYKRQALDTSPSRGFERQLEEELLDACGGKADCFPGNARLAARLHVHEKSIPKLLNRLAARGNWAVVDDGSIRGRRRIVDLRHPNADQVLEVLGASPHIRFERCRSNPEKIATAKGFTLSDNGHSRVIDHYPQGSSIVTPEGKLSLPEPLTVEPENLNPLNGEKISDLNGERLTADPAPGTPEWIQALAVDSAKNSSSFTVKTAAPVQAPSREFVMVVTGKPAPAAYVAGAPSATVVSGTGPGDAYQFVKDLGRGSTDVEITLAAQRLAVALNDGKSIRCLRRVVQLTAIGRIPVSVYADLKGSRNPAAVLMGRVRKHVPDLHDASLPGWIGARQPAR